jgi:hypothetical protein
MTPPPGEPVAINGGAGAVWSPGHCGPWPDDELSRMRRVTEMVPRDAPDHLLRLAMLFCGQCDMDEQFSLGELRSLGLTIAEIRDLAAVYLDRPAEPIGPHLAALLRRARNRADARIRTLQELRERIDQTLASDDLAGDALRDTDPRQGAVLDLAPGGKS